MRRLAVLAAVVPAAAQARVSVGAYGNTARFDQLTGQQTESGLVYLAWDQGRTWGFAVQLLPRQPRRTAAHRAEDRAKRRDHAAGDRRGKGRRASVRPGERHCGSGEADDHPTTCRDEQRAQPVLRVLRRRPSARRGDHDPLVPEGVPADLSAASRRHRAAADGAAPAARDAGRSDGRPLQPLPEPDRRLQPARRRRAERPGKPLPRLLPGPEVRRRIRQQLLRHERRLRVPPDRGALQGVPRQAVHVPGVVADPRRPGLRAGVRPVRAAPPPCAVHQLLQRPGRQRLRPWR
jgi:hypothetical protein